MSPKTKWGDFTQEAEEARPSTANKTSENSTVYPTGALELWRRTEEAFLGVFRPIKRPRVQTGLLY